MKTTHDMVAQSDVPPIRESKKWWAVSEDGVKEVTGYSCAPHNPNIWWCPELHASLTEKHHLFPAKWQAVEKALNEAYDELARIKAKISKLGGRA